MFTHNQCFEHNQEIGKQHSPRSATAGHGIASGAILFAKRNFIEKCNKNSKSHLMPLIINESRLTQMIMIGKSIIYI